MSVVDHVLSLRDNDRTVCNAVVVVAGVSSLIQAVDLHGA
jgi:hypothetical protein